MQSSSTTTLKYFNTLSKKVGANHYKSNIGLGNNNDIIEHTKLVDSPRKKSRDASNKRSASRKRSTSRGKNKFLVLKSTRPLTIPKEMNLRTQSRGRA